MAIVINSFEAVAETLQRQQEPEGGEAESETKPTTIDPHELAEAWRLISDQAMRSWAH